MSTKLSCGIVGLPNVGKSTLFNALTRNEAPASNYPFCTIDPNVGVVEVPDGRIPVLAELSKSARQLHAIMEFVDIAGLVKGASQGEGLGNKFLANIRETDAIVHIVRCFEKEGITHVDGEVDPIRDIETITLELILADLQMIENALPKVARQARGDKDAKPLMELLERCQKHLNENKPVSGLGLSDDELEILRPYPFLTAKKVLYVCNVGEDDLPEMENAFVQRVREYAQAQGNSVLTICAKIEEELAQLSPEDQKEFLADLGIEEPGLDRLIRSSFDLLGLITFLTAGPEETRAWTIKKGWAAPQAAGRIHTDIEQGFIRAEVVAYDDLVAHKGRVGAKEAGKMRSEGKEYVVEDGDVILFLHN